MARRRELPALALVLALVAGGCASGGLRPEHWLVCEFERLKVDDTVDEVRWTYDLTLRNKGKQSAELIHGFATVVLGSVRRSPDQVIGRRAIAPGETYRVPHTVIVRRAELANPQALMVKWQILGRYQDGYPIIAEVEVR
jgi:hypothetical protein